MRRSDAITGSIQGAVLALLAITLMTLPSLARADWSEAINVSGPGSSTSQTRIAGGVDGNSWVVWKREVAGHDVIQGTSVKLDGSQGAIVTLSDPGADATDPVIKAWEDGSVLVGWINKSTVDHSVATVTVTPEGTVGSPIVRSVPGPAGQPAKDVALAVGSGDDKTAAVSWLKYNGTDWVVQAVKIGEDGNSGTVHAISEPGSSAGKPAIAATTGTKNVYRLAWPQGSGSEGNVYSRLIDAEDKLEKEVDADTSQVTGEKIYKAILPRKRTEQNGQFGLGPGGNPEEVRLVYGSDGEMYIAWVRDRTDYIVNGLDDTFSKDPFAPNRREEDLETYEKDLFDTPYTGRTVEIIRSSSGTLNKAFPLPVNALTPFGPELPHPVVDFDMSQIAGGNPVMTWVNKRDGGDFIVRTGLVQNNQNRTFAHRTDGSGPLVQAIDPVVAANPAGAVIVGWTMPGLIPGEQSVNWRRFSDRFMEAFQLSGDFVHSADPGFVINGEGYTLAAFTAIDGADQGSSRVMAFAKEKLIAMPSTHNFGPVNVGTPRTSYFTLRSGGETPTEVNSISVSAGTDFALGETTDCVGPPTLELSAVKLIPEKTCQFRVTFTPSSTAVQNAKVTVNSTDGVREITLVGSGLNRTRNHLSVSPKSKMVRKGGTVSLKVNAANIGGVSSNATKVCARLNQKALKLQGSRCRQIGSLAAGASRQMTFKVRVTGRLKPGTKRTVMFKLSSDNTVIRQAVAQVGRKRR